jgi:hypothetical protein
MAKTYYIEELTDKKLIKIMYDDDKEYIKFKLKDYRELTPNKIDEKLRVLYAINTEHAQKWIALLEFVKANGWDKALANDANGLLKIKDKLKLYYNIGHEDFVVYMNDIEIYKPNTGVNIYGIPTIEELEEYGYGKLPYKEAKEKLLNAFEAIYIGFDNYKFDTETRMILDSLDRTFDNFIKIDLITFDMILDETYPIITTESKVIKNKHILNVDIDNLIDEINQNGEDCNITIEVEYMNEKTAKEIAKHYKKFKNHALRFFFQMVAEKSLPEAMILSYINFNNIGFVSGSYSDYPKDFDENIKKVFKMFKKFELERTINNLKNNKFEDIVVDDNGNIIDMKPKASQFNLKNIITREGPKIIIF